MNNLNSAISTAIRVAATREGVALTAIAEKAGIKTTSFFDRLTNKRNWDTDQIDAIAGALGFKSSFDLFSAAETERRLSDAPLGKVA